MASWRKNAALTSAAALSMLCQSEAFAPLSGPAMRLRSPAGSGFMGRPAPLVSRGVEAAGRLRASGGRLSGVKMVTQEMAQAASQMAGSLQDGSMHLAFADQGSNLAGKFFQASLLPYLGFLYALQQDSNGTPKMANFGFRYLLLFVIATIPTGIISKVGLLHHCLHLPHG